LLLAERAVAGRRAPPAAGMCVVLLPVVTTAVLLPGVARASSWGTMTRTGFDPPHG